MEKAIKSISESNRSGMPRSRPLYDYQVFTGWCPDHVVKNSERRGPWFLLLRNKSIANFIIVLDGLWPCIVIIFLLRNRLTVTAAVLMQPVISK